MPRPVVSAINALASRHAQRSCTYDFFHPTYYMPHFLRGLRGKPFVLTVYDMTEEIYPGSSGGLEMFFTRKRLLAEKAAHVIAISESTKRDLVRLYELPEEKVSVVHLANSLAPPPPESPRPVAAPYLLVVGRRGGYKNFPFFIRAAAKFLDEHRDCRVVCAGGGPFTAQERTVLEEEGITEMVVLHDACDDEMLARLYRHAMCFVLPSLYEGFGIPILEAFACGCPVLSSDRSSLPEVGGDAVRYFDPSDEASLVSALEHTTHPDEADRLRHAGAQRLAQFTWQKAAEATKQVYRKVLSNQPKPGQG
jgi:glycosyltransferase involved in cell wall biosynthesis